MPRVRLANYLVRLRRKHSRDREYLPVSAFEDGSDLHAVFEEYLRARSVTQHHDEVAQRLIRIEEFTVDDRTISGIVVTGAYGYASRLFDVRKDAISYNRRSSEAELIPFYFLMHVPAAGDEAVLILQRFGTMGIRKLLEGDFRSYFSDEFPQTMMDINPLVPSDIVERYMRRGALQKVVLTSFQVPEDPMRLFDLGDHQEEQAYFETVIRARRNQRLPIAQWIRRVMEGEMRLSDVAELREMNVDEVKLELNYGGSRRIVDLGRPQRFRAYIDISDEIDLEEGHPTLASIDRQAKALLPKLLTELHGEGGN